MTDLLVIGGGAAGCFSGSLSFIILLVFKIV